MSADGAPHTDDGHYILIHGRRWRASDPSIPGGLRQELVDELMSARRAVKDREAGARERVSDAKTALGERGAPWWDKPSAEDRQRRIVATANALLRHRVDKSICPSDVARAVGGGHWRDLMVVVRESIGQEVRSGRLQSTQRGNAVEVTSVRGPVRISKGVRFDVGAPTAARMNNEPPPPNASRPEDERHQSNDS